MRSDDALPGRPLYLRPLPEFLFRIDGNPFRYIARTWLLLLAGSLLLSVLVRLAVTEPKAPPVEVEGALPFLMLALVAPFLETLLMSVPLLLLNRFLGAGPAVLSSALLWGIAHSLSAPTWGLVAWWPFLIMSIAFLSWRERGILASIAVVTAVHVLQNSFAGALVLLLRRAA